MDSLKSSNTQIETLISQFTNYINGSERTRSTTLDNWYISRFSLLDIKGAADIKNIDDISNLITKYFEDFESRKNNQESGFKFSSLVLDELELREQLKQLSLNPEDYIRNAGNRSYILMSWDYFIYYYPDLKPQNDTTEVSSPPPEATKYVKKGEDRRGYAWDISSCDRIMAHAEKDSFIVFHDDSRTNVNWAESLKLLDKYSRNYFYSKRLIKNALLRAVNRYNPTDIQFLSDLTPDQIANHLLNSEPNINSKLLNFNRLKQLKRKINQPLASVLQRCQSLAELITTDSTRFLQLYLAGLISFTSGELKANLLKAIKAKQSVGGEINWKSLRKDAIESENNDISLIPQTELQYSQDALSGGNSLLFNVQLEKEMEEENIKKNHVFAPTQERHMFISDDNSPIVYFQRNDKTYQAPLENLNKDMQYSLLENRNRYSINYDKLINDLAKDLNSIQITEGVFDKAASRPHFDQTRKEELLRLISVPESTAQNNIPTVSNRVITAKNNIEDKIRQDNSNLNLDEPRMTRAERQKLNKELPEKVVGIHYYNESPRTRESSLNRDTSRSQSDFKTHAYKKEEKEKGIGDNRSYSDRRNDKNRYITDTYSRNRSNSRDTSRYRQNDTNKYKSGYVSNDRYKPYNRERSDSRNRHDSNSRYRPYNRDRSNSRDRYENRSRRNDSFNARNRSSSRNQNDYRNNRYSSSNDRRNYSRNASSDRYKGNYARSRSFSNDRNSYPRNSSQYGYKNENRRDGYRDNSRTRYSSRSNYHEKDRKFNNRPETNQDRRSRDMYRNRDKFDPRRSSRSFSRDNSYSRNNYNKSSRTNSGSFSRSQSPFNRRDNSFKRNNFSSDARSRSKEYRSRIDDRTNRYNRDKSQTYAMCVYQDMKPKQNCREDYNPFEQKICSKCLNNGHHEFKCTLYNEYNHEICTFCHRGHHMPNECKTKNESNAILTNLLKCEEFQNIMEKNE